MDVWIVTVLDLEKKKIERVEVWEGGRKARAREREMLRDCREEGGVRYGRPRWVVACERMVVRK